MPPFFASRRNATVDFGDNMAWVNLFADTSLMETVQNTAYVGVGLLYVHGLQIVGYLAAMGPFFFLQPWRLLSLALFVTAFTFIVYYWKDEGTLAAPPYLVKGLAFSIFHLIAWAAECILSDTAATKGVFSSRGDVLQTELNRVKRAVVKTVRDVPQKVADTVNTSVKNVMRTSITKRKSQFQDALHAKLDSATGGAAAKASAASGALKVADNAVGRVRVGRAAGANEGVGGGGGGAATATATATTKIGNVHTTSSV